MDSSLQRLPSPGSGSPHLTLLPAHGYEHTHTVVFLHDRGGRAEHICQSLNDWRNLQGFNLTEVLPNFRWVFPQAPMGTVAREPSEQCNQWFDIWDVNDLANYENLQAEGLREVIPHIRDILAKEANDLGGRWDKVILMGFGMGSDTSLHTLFNLDIPTEGQRLGAFIDLNGRCPFAGRTLEQMRQTVQVVASPTHNHVLRNTPMLLEHCADDPFVPVWLGLQQRAILCEFGANVTWWEYPNGGHGFNWLYGVDHVVQFLSAVL